MSEFRVLPEREEIVTSGRAFMVGEKVALSRQHLCMIFNGNPVLTVRRREVRPEYFREELFRCPAERIF